MCGCTWQPSAKTTDGDDDGISSCAYMNAEWGFKICDFVHDDKDPIAGGGEARVEYGRESVGNNELICDCGLDGEYSSGDGGKAVYGYEGNSNDGGGLNGKFIGGGKRDCLDCAEIGGKDGDGSVSNAMMGEEVNDGDEDDSDGCLMMEEEANEKFFQDFIMGKYVDDGSLLELILHEEADRAKGQKCNARKPCEAGDDGKHGYG